MDDLTPAFVLVVFFFLILGGAAGGWFWSRRCKDPHRNQSKDEQQVFRIERHNEEYVCVWPDSALFFPSAGRMGLIKFLNKEIERLSIVKDCVNHTLKYDPEPVEQQPEPPAEQKPETTPEPHPKRHVEPEPPITKPEPKKRMVDTSASGLVETLNQIKTELEEKKEEGLKVDIPLLEDNFRQRHGRKPNIREVAVELARTQHKPMTECWDILRRVGYSPQK